MPTRPLTPLGKGRDMRGINKLHTVWGGLTNTWQVRSQTREPACLVPVLVLSLASVATTPEVRGKQGMTMAAVRMKQFMDVEQSSAMEHLLSLSHLQARPLSPTLEPQPPSPPLHFDGC